MNFLKFVKFSLIIFSILLIIYNFYRSEIIHDGSLRGYYKWYYFISIFLFIFSASLFLINEKKATYLSIIFISIIFSLYIVEAYLTFFTITRGSIKIPQEKINAYKLKTGKDYDRRQKFEVYDDLKKIDPNITVAIHPRLHVKENLYSLSGISNSNTILCNEGGYYAIYKSDRYGFNNNDKDWSSKNIEYLVVGDSFTMGECVNYNGTIHYNLKKLSNKSALTIGFGGNGPLTEYAALKEYLPPNVKNIIWVYAEGNDQVDIVDELKDKILNKYINNKEFSQNLIQKQSKIDKLNRSVIELERIRLSFKKERSFPYKFIKFLKIFNTRDMILQQGILRGQTEDIVKPEFKKIILLAQKLAAKNNSKLYFVYMPRFQVSTGLYDWNVNQYRTVKKMIKDELGIPFIDIYKEIFENEKNPLKFFPLGVDGHFNELGYKEIAKVIYKHTSD